MNDVITSLKKQARTLTEIVDNPRYPLPERCPRCDNKGYYPEANGADDFDNVACLCEYGDRIFTRTCKGCGALAERGNATTIEWVCGNCQ